MPEITLVARFQLDDHGEPTYVKAGGVKHYRIDLNVLTDDLTVRSVTYLLHPTYYDNKRDSDDKLSNFHEEITSYGDYTITVRTHGTTTIIKKAGLAELLHAAHDPPANPAISAALHDIATN